MTMRERFAACAGLDTTAIAAEFEGDDLDEVCREILLVCAERTDVTGLPSDPFTIRHTMYGDVDVSDFVLRYDKGSSSVEEPSPDESLDGHARWEHWEDAVRLFNGDVPTSSLVFANRITSAIPGDFANRITAGTSGANRAEGSALRRWLTAVDFAGTAGTATTERLLGELSDLLRKNPAGVDGYVEKVGMQALVTARSDGLGHALIEIGARDDVRSFYIRCDVAVDPPASAKVAWDENGRPVVTETTFDVPDDPDRGATMRFKTAHSFLEVAGRTKVLAQQMADGTATLEGSAESVNQFWKAMMHFSRNLG
jgi:hypothetical protein